MDLALEIVTQEGHDALTMQRIATGLDCGIATVYRLFPSRDALVAELLHQALDTLHGSWLLGLSHLDDYLAKAAVAGADAALARALGAAWFWVVAEDTYGPEIDLARRLFIDRDIVVPDDQAALVVPASLRLLNEGRQRIDDAVEAGALEPGNGVERAIVLIASITGVVLTAKFSRWDASLFDARALAARATQDAFRAWGAPPEAIEAAFAIVDGLDHTRGLAPRVG